METSVNNKCRAFTSLEQSRKLAKILPLESADMRYSPLGGTHPWVLENDLIEKDAVLCWSLAALLNYLREIDFFPDIEADEYSVTMNINYYNEEEARPLAPVYSIKVEADNLIDACYEMIIKLNELKML